MTRPSVLALVPLLLAGCAAFTATLADSRTGTMPILTSTLPTVPGAVEQPATVTGRLSLPEGSTGRVPAVIILHSCDGVKPNIDDWAHELNGVGYAAMVLDSFSGRQVTQVCTGQTSVSVGSRLADAFRAQELLATHPGIEPRQIAVLGFSHGGWVSLWASQAYYQRRFMRGNTPPFAAHLAFYPVGCNVHLLDEMDMPGGPVRIFAGTEDDWTPIGPCREWVERRRAAGRDVALIAYEGARHAFDVPFFATPRTFPEVVNPARCTMYQRPDGTFVDERGRRFSGASPCMTRGASMAYDARAHARAVADVKAFLAGVFAQR